MKKGYKVALIVEYLGEATDFHDMGIYNVRVRMHHAAESQGMVYE